MTVEKRGTRAKRDEPATKGALISDATLLELHRRLLIAVGRKRGRASGRKGIGQYAAAHVAMRFDLRSEDTVVDGKGSRLKKALGAALLIKAQKNRQMVLVWGGDEWQDALEAARAHSLPMVFVGEASEEGDARAVLPRANKALKPGEELPCVTVDGHDVVAAYRVAHEAIERARRDRGPTLIQLATYKIGDHAFTDAVADMDRYLRGRGLLKQGPRERGTGKTEKRGRGPRSEVAGVKGADTALFYFARGCVRS